jgi:putative phage-type endonuclease
MTDYINTTDMDREDWLSYRKNSIGSSEAAAALGQNPYWSPLAVWMEKTGELPPPDDEMIQESENEWSYTPLRAGRLLEPVVAQTFMECTGLTLQKDNKMRFHPDYPYLSCNLDRIVLSGEQEDEPGVCELKTVASDAMKSWDAEIAPWYYIQLQHQLMVTGYRYGYFGFLIFGFGGRIERFKVLRYDRDDELINDYLILGLQHFWHEYVVKQVNPPPETDEDIKRLYPQEEDGKVVEANTPAIEAHQELMALRDKKKQLKSEESALKRTLQDYMQDAEVLLYDNRPLATWKTDSRGSRRFVPKEYEEE